MHQWYLLCENSEGGRREFALEQPRYTVGRGATGDDGVSHLCISGDTLVSRQHFEVIPAGGGAVIRRLASGRNPIFYQGRECDEFTLSIGDSFMVGQTRCSLIRSEDSFATERSEFSLAGPGREKARQRSSYECFQALMRMLPELRRAADIETVWSTSLGVLITLLPEAYCVMVLDGERVLHSLPAGHAAQASRRLVARAHQEKCTVTHFWDENTGAEATVLDKVSWAVASPVEQQTFYAMGNASPDDLEGKAVLIDVVAETVAHYLALQQFQRLQSQVGQFFSPVLRRILSEQDFREVLKPKRAEVTVLFFDLRGFSKATETAEDSLDDFLQHHEILTNVMTEITECIFAREGVVIDYQGDAILACWGAPNPRADHALQAVEAARAILARVYSMDLPFKSQKGGRNLRCGLGLGSGDVIAGQIGARDQTKFGIMGKVVNHASRLEGLTKQLGVPMLINADLYHKLPADQIVTRCVGKVRPAGVREASEIYEVVVPVEHGGSGLTSQESAAYADAYRAYCEGDWRTGLQHLRQVPLEDPIGSFLMREILNRQEDDLPRNWDGVLEFRSK